MPLIAATVLLTAIALPAQAWEKIEGGVTARPVDTNSTVEALFVHCLEGPAIDLYAKNSGPVLPLEGVTSADYFYKPGLIRADVDGKSFPLVAAGSDIAVVLFSEGPAAESYLAPVDPDLFKAMLAGRTLVIGFDILASSAPDGSPFETFARFDLAGSTEPLGAAIAACG